MVLVAHRLSTVINADLICVVNEGEIIEQGTHEELYSRKGNYYSLVQRQLKKKSEIVEQDGVTSANEEEE